MCLNKKVIAGLAVSALVIFAAAPRLLTAALPLLLVAACPLSMLFMMRGMSGNRSRDNRSDDAAQQYSATGGEERDGDRELGELREEVNRLKAELRLRADEPRS